MAMNVSHRGIQGTVGKFDRHPIAGFELANGAHDLALAIPHQAEPPPQEVLGG
jgi:hypothetical protein